MGLLRGLADDVQLLDWLMHYMWPAEGKFVSQEFVRVGSALTITELLRCGVTCVNDMYFFPDVTAKLINNCGMRATVGAPIIHFPTAWASNIDEYFDKGKKLIEEYKNHPRVTTIFAPHAPYTVDDPTFRKIKEVSEQYNTKIHCHIHETMKEIEDHVKSPDHNGARPLERLDKLGLLNERLIAVHMTHLTKEEIKLVAARKVSVVHCPESNLKLGSGICPVRELLNSGANVCLGTDGSASNDDVDLLGEMRTSALIDKLKVEDAPVPAWQMLKMGTLNGAKALGLDHKIGSLEVGKDADFVAVKLRCHPIYNPITSLVYNGTNSVEYVWVEGNMLLENRKIRTMDEFSLLKDAAVWHEKISSWDKGRRVASVPEINKSMEAADEAIKGKDKKKLQDSLKALDEINQNMFHWLFFASRGEQVGATSQELQKLVPLLSEKVEKIKAVL